MSDATRSVLHEVMVSKPSRPLHTFLTPPKKEQQTVSIAKAGIITLNARTSILAAANPVNSKYDPDLPITRNIDLPPTLISVLDTIDEDLDRKLARHIVGLYLDDEAQGAGSGTRQRGREEDEEEHLVRYLFLTDQSHFETNQPTSTAPWRPVGLHNICTNPHQPHNFPRSKRGARIGLHRLASPFLFHLYWHHPKLREANNGNDPPTRIAHPSLRSTRPNAILRLCPSCRCARSKQADAGSYQDKCDGS